MEFVDKMLTEADCIILRDEGRVTDEGAVVQERNAAMGEGRQAPVTRPVEDARVTEMMRRLATLNNDVRYLDASFTVLANFVGLRRDEVVTAATQLLLHGGHAGTGVKAEAGGTKNAPRTPQRPSAHKGRDDSSPEEDGVRNATRVVLASTFAACEPTSTLLQNPHLAHGTIPHWMFTRGMHQFGAGVPAGAGVWGDTRGKETVKAEEEEDLVSDIDDEEDDDEACASKYTGVKLDKASGKYGMKILIKEGGKCKQQRLGAYTTEEEGAFAYAAGAFVLRPRDKIPNTVSLSAAEKAMLRGCTKEDLQILVEARKWWRWRSWQEALDSVSSKLKRGRKRGGATGTSKRHRVVDSNTMATNEPEVPDNAESGGTAPVSEQGGGAKNNEQEERGEDTGAHENTGGGRSRRVSLPLAYLRASYQLTMPRGRLSNGKRGAAIPKRLSLAKKGKEVVQPEQGPVALPSRPRGPTLAAPVATLRGLAAALSGLVAAPPGPAAVPSAALPPFTAPPSPPSSRAAVAAELPSRRAYEPPLPLCRRAAVAAVAAEPPMPPS
ncbi:unnamed protein product [Closterium sp. NIES-65]|nr:unnamed protein product [Closterium sp. NIES-65]